MAHVEEHPTTHTNTRRAWIAVAFTPVLFVAGIVISLAASGAGPGLGGALVGMLSLAAPTVALILGLAAMRAKEPEARTVLAVGAVLFAVCVVLLPVAVISVNAWLIAVAASVVMFALAGSRLAR